MDREALVDDEHSSSTYARTFIGRNPISVNESSVRAIGAADKFISSSTTDALAILSTSGIEEGGVVVDEELTVGMTQEEDLV